MLIGDGESQAGIVWEGAAAAAKYRLANLVVILDLNDVQLDGPVHEIMPMPDIEQRWKSYGWQVIEVNGHDVRQLVDAFELAKEIHDRPACIIARTTKGKGVFFMENESYWHGNVPNSEQLALALLELNAKEG